MAENDVEQELLDYDEEDTAAEQTANGTDTGDTKKGVKGNYVSIHASGFRDFLLKPELLRAIVDCGFEHPSEGNAPNSYDRHLLKSAIFYSSRPVYTTGYSRNGYHLSSEKWYGKDSCVCHCYVAAARADGRSSVSASYVSRKVSEIYFTNEAVLTIPFTT